MVKAIKEISDKIALLGDEAYPQEISVKRGDYELVVIYDKNYLSDEGVLYGSAYLLGPDIHSGDFGGAFTTKFKGNPALSIPDKESKLSELKLGPDIKNCSRELVRLISIQLVRKFNKKPNLSLLTLLSEEALKPYSKKYF